MTKAEKRDLRMMDDLKSLNARKWARKHIEEQVGHSGMPSTEDVRDDTPFFRGVCASLEVAYMTAWDKALEYERGKERRWGAEAD